MTSTKLLHALAVLTLSTTATVAYANDTVEGQAPSALTVAMGESLGQPQAAGRELRSPSHGRHAAPHSARAAAPLVASERPPRPPIAVAKSTGRAEGVTTRVGSAHIFPPRGIPKW